MGPERVLGLSIVFVLLPGALSRFISIMRFGDEGEGRGELFGLSGRPIDMLSEVGLLLFTSGRCQKPARC